LASTPNRAEWRGHASKTQSDTGLAFAGGHLPGAVGIELGDDFATWVGWLLPFDAPVVLVLDPDQDASEARVQLARIAFDHLRCVLRGVDGWRGEGRPLASFEVVDVAAFTHAMHSGAASQVLDVRSSAEWQSEHLVGSVYRYLPGLTAGPPTELQADQDVWVVCASGYRANIAGSLLQRAGYRPIVLLQGGVRDVLAALSSSSPDRVAA